MTVSQPDARQSHDPAEPKRGVFDTPTLERDLELRDVLRAMFGDDAGQDVGPTAIGRYQILQKLGAGGMGSVYEALDPNLDRRVAIKLLHADAPSEDRLVAEGKAMAKLNHPNIVTVHDVDTVDGRVFVAMEMVEGLTLRQWQRAKHRSWREVIAMYRQIGRGIVAAHETGLIHCDLKPENVLVGNDGRPRVTDFGIAQLLSEPTITATGSSTQDDGLGPSTVEPRRTSHTKSLSGTPHYMAPEVYQGRALDERADQFSFCVMLWEALFGHRPFDGGTIFELGANIIAGQRKLPPERHRVPAWLRRACERGLATEPHKRWPSIAVLVEELDRGQTRARRRVAAAVVGITVFAGLAIGGIVEARHAQRVAACERAGDSITELWNEGARETVHSAILATGLSYAPDTANKVVPWLDARADQWSATRTEACLNGEVRETWDPKTYARAKWCLADQRLELEVAIEELRQPSSETVENAVVLAAKPTASAPCLDERGLEALSLPETASEREASALRRELARADAAFFAGRYQQSLAQLEALGPRAAELGWPPLSAEVKGHHAHVLATLDRNKEAGALAIESYFEAMAHGAPGTALNAANLLVTIDGEHDAKPETARLWAGHTELLLDALGLREQHAGASFLVRRGHIALQTGDLEAAGRDYGDALAMIERLHGADHPRATIIWGHMGSLARAAGDYPRAIEIARRVLELQREQLGPRHPRVAKAFLDLGIALADNAQPSEALPLLRTALEIEEAVRGPNNEKMADALTNLAGVYQKMGEAERGQTMLKRALEIFESTLKPDHPRIGVALNNLSNALRSQGKFADAKPLLKRALQIFEANRSPQLTLAIVANNLGETHLQLGELEPGRELLERSLRLRQEVLEPGHQRLGVPLALLAQIAVSQNRLDDAFELANQADEILSRPGGMPNYATIAAQTLGDLLWGHRGDKTQAIAVVTRSRDAMRSRGPDAGDAVEKLDRWLDTHPAPK